MKKFIALIVFLTLIPLVNPISYQSIIPLGTNQTICLTTHNISGSLKDADSGYPFFNVTNNSVFGTKLADGNLIKYSTGFYCGNFNVNSTSFVAGKTYPLFVYAKVQGVIGGYVGSFYVASVGHDTDAVATNIDDIETDTAAMDTAAEWDTLLVNRIANANAQYQNLSLNTSNSATYLYSVLSKITVGDIMNAVVQNSSKKFNTTIGETWAAAGTGSCDLTGVEEGLQTNASDIKKNVTDTVSGGTCDLTSVYAGIQSNETALEVYIHSKYTNITSNCSTPIASIPTNVWNAATRTLTVADWTTDADLATLQTIINANLQYMNITGNCSKDVATIMSYVDVLPATAPVSWNDMIDVDILLTTLQNNMNKNTSLIVQTIKDTNTTILVNFSTTQSNIMNSLGLVLLGMTSNSSNISSGISSVLRDIAITQADLDNPNQYKADVTALQTIVNANSQYQNITLNTSKGVSNVAAEVWTNSVRTLTVADWTTDGDLVTLQTINNANAQYQNVTLNMSQGITYVINTGNNNWITATGFATSTQASDLLKGVQSNGTIILLGMGLNATNIMKNVTDTIGVTDISSLQTIVNANLQYHNITSNTSQGQTYIISIVPSTTDIDNVIEDEAIITNLGTNFTGLFGNQTNLKQVVDDIKRGLPDNTSLIISVVSQNTTATILNISKSITEVKDEVTSSTYGLSALKTLIDTIQTSINGLVGNIWNAVMKSGTSANTTISDTLSNASTAVISSADKTDIANQTFRKLIQNKIITYYNTSLGYPTNETEDFGDGTNIIIKYRYSSDNQTIYQRNESLTN